MNIGSSTQSNPISTVMHQAVGTESKPYEREPDGDRDSLLKVQPVASKTPQAAVGKGVGLLIDISV